MEGKKNDSLIAGIKEPSTATATANAENDFGRYFSIYGKTVIRYNPVNDL